MSEDLKQIETPSWFEPFKKVILSIMDNLFKKQEPDRPDAPPVIIESAKAYLPKIIPVTGVRYKKNGYFKTKSGKALGAVVHYTVSGRTASNARGVVAYLAKNGLGCLVMDESGDFYCAENYDYMKDVVWHAGNSSWMGKTGVSSYCIGIEICNWGSDGEKRGAKDLRKVDKNANVKPGTYQKYTPAQEKSLIAFLKYCKSVNPEFSYDWVVGHDEISPTRKSDPGGSLSVTMPVLRSTLKKA